MLIITFKILLTDSRKHMVNERNFLMLLSLLKTRLSSCPQEAGDMGYESGFTEEPVSPKLHSTSMGD